MIPDLNRLKSFYYAYRSGSVSAAAKELFITQSAASQSIKNLEGQLQLRLFNRSGRKILPTRPADQLFKIIAPFMLSLERGIEIIEKQQNELSGTLRIGAPVEFGSKYLTGIFAGFRAKYPSVSFAMTLGQPAQLLSELTQGRLDIAFADIFSSSSEYAREFAVFSIKLAAQEKLVLTCSKEYFQRYLTGRLTPDKLLLCSFLEYNKNAPAVKSWFNHHYKITGIQPEIALTVESVQAIISAIKAGMGLGIVPEYLIAPELSSGKIVKIKTGRPDLINKISLARLKGGAPSATEKAFMDYFLRKSADFSAK